MKLTINDKATALLDFLKTTDPDKFIYQEEIIANLPDYFRAKISTTGTTLDRAIHTAVEYINKQGKYIIVNNRRRGYKIANAAEAKEYVNNLFRIHARGFKRAHNIIKVMKLDGTFDLFENEYKQIFEYDPNEANHDN